MELEIKNIDGSLFIFNEELNLRGVGKTVKEMLEDFYLDILSAYNLYVKSGKELTPVAEKIKNELMKLIKTENYIV